MRKIPNINTHIFKQPGLVWSVEFAYLSTPNAPTFGTTTTINPTDTDILTADLGGNTDIILGSGLHKPRVNISSVVGTSVTPIRFKGVMTGDAEKGIFLTQIGDDTITDSSLKSLGGEFHEFYDLYCYGGTGIHHTAGAENVKYQNVKVRDNFLNSFAGFLIKSDNNTTVTPYLVEISNSSVRNVLGEGFYIGQVIDTGSGFHNFSNVIINHLDISENGREAGQISHCEDSTLNHITGLGCGRTNEGSQNRPFQNQDSNGILKNSLFSSVATLGSVYSCYHNGDGYTYFNSYFEAQNSFYIGNQASHSWYAASTIKGNQDIVLDNLILNSSIGYNIGAQYWAIRHLGDVQNVRVRNCIIPDNLTDFIRDDSGGTYASILEYNNIILPASHAAFNPAYNDKGQVTSEFHYKRGMGKDLPDPTIPSYSSLVLTGTPEERAILTATFSGFYSGSDNNGNVLTAQTPTYQWQRDTDGTGTTYVDIVGENSSTYTLGLNDVGKLVRCAGQAVNEVYLAGVLQYTNATTAIAANFSPFSSIAWENALDLNAPNIATDEFVLNQGSDSNALKTADALPSYDGTYGGLTFSSVTQQSLTLEYGSINTDHETWWNGRLDALTGNQRVFAFGVSHQMRVKSTGEIVWGGVSTGVLLVANTDYLIRFYINGASSTITVNNGTPVSFTASTGTNNVTGRIGCEHDSTDYCDAKMKSFFHKNAALTAGNITDIWTYYGL